MKSFLVLCAAAAAVVAVSNAADPCSQYNDQKSCDGNSTCTWCKCAAVPSSCWSKADASHLPPGVYVCDNSLDQVSQVIAGNSSCLTPKQDAELKEAISGINTLLKTTVVALDLAAAAEPNGTVKANLELAAKIIGAVDNVLVANLTKIVEESCGTCKQIVQAVNDAVNTIEQTLAKIEPDWQKDPIWKAVVTAVQAILSIVKDLCPSSAVETRLAGDFSRPH
jgi:hypothetical protein